MDQRGLWYRCGHKAQIQNGADPLDPSDSFFTVCGGLYYDELHVFKVVFNHLGDTSDKLEPERILIDGKETGIDNLEFVYDGVKKLKLDNNTAITGELFKRGKVFDDVPTKKMDGSGEALLGECQNFLAEQYLQHDNSHKNMTLRRTQL